MHMLLGTLSTCACHLLEDICTLLPPAKWSLQLRNDAAWTLVMLFLISAVHSSLDGFNEVYGSCLTLYTVLAEGGNGKIC